ncbi:GGDEF domain-containing protein [Sulfurovum sp.]
MYLDNFKIINDTYEHKAGDFILKNIINNIQKVIRKNDFFTRIAGDELCK